MNLHKCRLCICLHSEVLFSTPSIFSDTHFELLPVSVAFWQTEMMLKGSSEGEFPRRYIMFFCDDTSLKTSVPERLVLL